MAHGHDEFAVFRHADEGTRSEQASPAYYSVAYDDSGIRTEIAAAERVGIYRFTADKGGFKLLVDGKPHAGLEVEITRGGTRYRNAQDEIKVTSDAKGEFSVTWPEAGMYWLETGSEDNKTSVKQAAVRRLSYVATLEVLPQ